MLKTRNIFIDTQVFISEGFFNSGNLKRLSKYGNADIVNLFLTEITINEIKANATKKILDAKSTINDFKKKLSPKVKFIAELEQFSNCIEEINQGIDTWNKRIIEDFEDFLKIGKIKVIKNDFANINDVINKYFKNEKPFNAGDKKHEFPDAIALSALENYCTKEDCQMYIISADHDIKNYKSAHLIPVIKLRKLLDLINTQELSFADVLHEIFRKSRIRIEKEISNRFENEMKENYSGAYSLKNVNVENIVLYEESIINYVEINGETIFELDADIDFTVDLKKESYYYTNDGKSQWDNQIYTISTGSTVTANIGIETFLTKKGEINKEEYSVYCSYCSIPDADEIEEYGP